MLISLAGAGVCGFASWHLLEKPALGFKPRRPRGQTAAAPRKEPYESTVLAPADTARGRVDVALN
jgi:hypothetical protein